MSADSNDVKTYSIDELMTLTGLSARTIRHYATYGIISHPKLAGAATRYPRKTLARALAAKEWREEGLSLFNIRRALNTCTAEELESHAAFVDPIEGARQTEGAKTGGGSRRAVAAPEQTATALREGAATAGERWVRFVLVPGLELALREGGSELAGRMAEEIRRRYGG